MTTDELISQLCSKLAPVRRLPSPAVLLGAWLMICLLAIGGAVLHYGLRPDLAERLSEGFQAPQVLTALVTGVLSAFAAFRLVRPDDDRRWALLPLPGLLLWLLVMGGFCLDEVRRFGLAGLAIEASYPCLVFVLGVGGPLSLVMMWMARHAEPLCPSLVSTLGGFSAAAFASVGLSLVNGLNAPVMVLVWHGLAIAATTLLVRTLGPGCMRLMIR